MKSLANLKLINLFLSMVLIFGLAACNKQDTATESAADNSSQTSEDAGQKIDQATDNAAAAIDDAAITAKVKSAIVAESGLEAFQINVDTAKGVVTLTGTVDSQTNSDRAAAVATGVSDVKGVENKLEVKAAS